MLILLVLLLFDICYLFVVVVLCCVRCARWLLLFVGCFDLCVICCLLFVVGVLVAYGL